MGPLATIAMWLGFPLCLVGWFWLLFEAFKTSFLWGLVSLLVWPVLPVWLFLHFDRGKWPGLIWTIGAVLSSVALYAIVAASG